MKTNEFKIIRNLYKNLEKPLNLHNLYIEEDSKTSLYEEIKKGDISIGNEIYKLKKVLTDYFKNEQLNIGLLNSGTSALHLALETLNLTDQDDILISPITFIAPVNAIKYAGGEPFFLDVNEDTLNISPSALLDFIEKNTSEKNGKLINHISGNEIKGLIHVDVFGQIGELDKIYEICKKYNIFCIEDAAESFGSKLNNFNIGKYCDLVTGSFNGNKIISGGGGGFVGSKNQDKINEIVQMSNHSKTGKEWEYDHDKIGYNYRINNLQATLINSQIKNLNKIVSKKRKLHDYYYEYFKETEITLFNEIKNNKSNYWLNTIKLNLNNIEVDSLLTILNEEGIKCRKLWKLMTKINHHKSKNNFSDLSQSKKISEKIINIPSGLDIYSNIIK
tara:strand:- start:1450 stop:2619 length:1170 start_codon:yes stop_codon:yes gene_type:complete